MSETNDAGRDGLAAAPTASTRPRRATDSLEPLDRQARRAKTAAENLEVAAPGDPSYRPGDLPQSLARRYLSERLRGGASVALYEGPGAKRIALHDHGDRLTTDQSHPAVVRDIALIALHRGWSAVRVRGQDEFRREVWLQAQAMGLEVRGYKPRERDQQELAQRIAAQDRPPTSPPDRDRTPARPDRSSEAAPTDRRPAARPDFAKGVSGILLETGEAPYRRRAGEPLTPYIRLQREDARPLDIWGAGLPQALARSGAMVGDALQVRRDGVDVIQRSITVKDPKTGRSSTEVRDVTRNRWVIDAERFRAATPSQAARDGDLQGAQSHLQVLNSVIDVSVRDVTLREALRAEARELVAGELAEGRRFSSARVREVEPVLARDLAAAYARETSEPARGR